MPKIQWLGNFSTGRTHWYKDFGLFKLCGEGQYPKTFLLKGQAVRGQDVD
jgi:hypothetical protein